MSSRRTLRLLAAGVLFVAASAFAQGPPIKVVLLGTGRPDPAIDRFGPATLVQAGGQNLLFDAGRGATQRFMLNTRPRGYCREHPRIRCASR